MRQVRIAVLVLFFIGAASWKVRTVTLRFDPPQNQLAMYAMYTHLDGSVTKPQQFEGLVGFTSAVYSTQTIQKNYCAATSELYFSSYDFNKQSYKLGEGTEGGQGGPGGAPTPGGGGGEGPSPGGGGGPSPGGGTSPIVIGGPDNGSDHRAGSSSEGGKKPIVIGGGDPNLQYGPGGGGGGGAGPSRRGGGAAPTGRLDISDQLRQGLTLIQNCKGEVLGSRGAELSRIKEEDESAQSMDQLLELAFSPYYPDKPVTVGDSWTNSKYFTMLGVRKKRPITLKYTVWPTFDIFTIRGTDEDVGAVFNPNRFFYAYLVMFRMQGEPGYSAYGIDPVAAVTYSGADVFDDSESLDTDKLHIERSFQGKFNMGAIAIYDYKNNTPISLSITQHVEYWKKEKSAPLNPASYLKPKSEHQLVKYTLDFDLFRVAVESPPQLMRKIVRDTNAHY